MDETPRRVGPGDDLSGRSDEATRNYADDPAQSAARRAAESTRSTTRTPPSGERAELDPEADRRAREIQGEIAHTRAEMSETIEAIQERLRPSNLVSDATEKVKTVTTEKVKSMADTASGTAQGMMRETRDRAQGFMEGARQNPIPALMIGAGVAWMLMERRKGGNGHARHAGWSEHSSPGYTSYQEQDYSAQTDYSEGNDIRGVHQYGSGSEGIKSKARDAASEAKRKARFTAQRTQSGLQRIIQQNPLLVGAAAVMAGAAIGASLPETERENELMGETRDTVVDKAQEAARGAAGTVRDVAGETVGDAVGKVAKRVTSKDA